MEALRNKMEYLFADSEKKKLLDRARQRIHLFDEKKQLVELVKLKERIKDSLERSTLLRETAVQDLQRLKITANGNEERIMEKITREIEIVDLDKNWPPSSMKSNFKTIDKQGPKLLERLDYVCAKSDTECAAMKNSLRKLLEETQDLKTKCL